MTHRPASAAAWLSGRARRLIQRTAAKRAGSTSSRWSKRTRLVGSGPLRPLACLGRDRTAYDEKQKYRIARYKKQVAEGVKNPFLLVRAKNALEQYDKYGFYFDKVQEFVRKVESDHRMTGFDTKATLNDVEDYIKTNNLTDVIYILS